MKYPKYPAYKESGIEWLGTIPNHWKTLPIKYVASSNDDVLIEDTAEDFEIEYVEISGVDDVKGIFSTETHQFKNAPSRARRRVRNGDIIISTVRTYLKAIASIKNPPDNLIVSTGFAVIRPKDSIFPRFASYLFKTNYLVHEVIARSTGISYPAINTSELVRIRAILPPYEEQRTIAAFLDAETAQIDTLIAKQERLIALLQEKRQALISHAVTKGLNPDAPMKDSGVEWLGEVPAHWEVKKLKYLASKIGSGKTPRGGSEVYVDDGILFIRSQNVYDDGLRLDDVAYITSETDSEMSDTRILPGDILLNITGASLGRTCITPDGIPTANVNQHVCIIRIDRPEIRPFVSLAMKSLSIKSQIDVSQNGAAREGLNYTQIGMLTVGVPPSDEQEAIAEFVNRETAQIDTLIEKAKAAIERLQERRTALISAAVTGKIDVRAAMN